MKILVTGVGAIGSNLVASLLPDIRGEHTITVLDKDKIEERNVNANTQFYSPDQVGMDKVEALQYNCYRWFFREIGIIDEELTENNREILGDYDLVIDCFDNHDARKITYDWGNDHSRAVVHVGFSDQFTFSVEWNENYKPPTDIKSGFDICEMAGASSFIKMASATASLVVQKYIRENIRTEVVGNKFSIHEVI